MLARDRGEEVWTTGGYYRYHTGTGSKDQGPLCCSDVDPEWITAVDFTLKIYIWEIKQILGTALKVKP
jgi:hypothetical protein